MPKVLIAGYPYVRENFLKVFDYYPEKVVFALPKEWPVKGGKVVYRPPQRENVFGLKTFFSNSDYPLIGGLLKGWMPGFPLVLLKNRNKIDMVFSATEPILLSTLYQTIWARIFGFEHLFFTWENIDYEDKFKGINWVIKKIILKLNLALSRGVICGNSQAEKIIKQFTDKKTVVIPLSGVDPEFFKPIYVPKEFDDISLADKIVFTFVGSISYRKGIHIILRALKDLVHSVVNVRLILVGSGEYDHEIAALVEELNLKNFVIRVSWVNHEDLRNILAISDIFLYPSIPHKGWEEQFGYSMAEASLMELPVISTRSGSVADIIKHHKTGLLVTPGSVEELKLAMLELTNNKELRLQLGKEGRLYVSNNYSHQIIADRFFNFFKTV